MLKIVAQEYFIFLLASLFGLATVLSPAPALAQLSPTSELNKLNKKKVLNSLEVDYAIMLERAQDVQFIAMEARELKDMFMDLNRLLQDQSKQIELSLENVCSARHETIEAVKNIAYLVGVDEKLAVSSLQGEGGQLPVRKEGFLKKLMRKLGWKKKVKNAKAK